ncbi:DUF1107 domain-containing protein [Pseudaeromonas paramecii]|uniref:DUF1107 domain-containing protein n=1 Tax=Pseudaeromonas paramecii TaxID=2138166 RepID=A0ABP8Q1S3_9GAMM
MRIFKKYLPLMIARYVKTFFKGRLYIQGRGGYQFEQGKLMMPMQADTLHKHTVQEINQTIANLNKQAA